MSKLFGFATLAIFDICNYLLHLDQEEGVDITANSLHPGAIVTNLFRYSSAINGNYLVLFMFCIGITQVL